MISGLDFPALVRGSTWARVAASEPIRVNTIRHRAWLACRSPPGLRRGRGTFPDDAGIGAAGARGAPAASERSPPGWGPAAVRRAAGAWPIPYAAGGPGA